MGDILNSEYSRTAIALLDFRQTALFFDYVIPFNIIFEVMIDLSQGNKPSKIEDSLPTNILSEILPPYLKSNEEFIRIHAETNQVMSELMINMLLQKISQGVNDSDLIQKNADLALSATSKISHVISNYGLENAHIEAPLANIFGKQSNADGVVMSVASLNLIDTRKITWEHIHEFRKSEEAVSKLRRFRLFAFDTYKDKSKAYMEDDILIRLKDYNDTVNQWGFETLEGTIDSVVNSKLMAGFLSGALVTSIVGQPTLAAISAIAGAVLGIGCLSLKFMKRKIAFGELAKDHPVSYIEYAKKELAKDK